jgi:hypothetical protein
MTIQKLVAGASVADPLASTGADVAAAVNGLIDLSVASIKSLPLAADAKTDTVYNVIGFYVDSVVGGGSFIWDATRNKAQHNGGTIIAPEAIAGWDGTPQNISQLLGWAGAGAGCFVRAGLADSVNAYDFGLSALNVDAAIVLNKALSVAKTVFVPAITVNVNTTILLPLDSHLVGFGSTSSVLLVGAGLADSYVINYGTSYSYGGYRGSVQGLRIESGAAGVNRGLGIRLFSGITLRDVAFFETKCAIVKNISDYVDKITIDRCFFGYCGGHASLAVIDILGDTDALKMSGCHFVLAYQEATTLTERDGMKLTLCRNAVFDANIFNGSITIDRCSAISINGHHAEGSQHPSYKGNRTPITISRSDVVINGLFCHQRVDGPNIHLRRIAPTDTQETCSLNISDARFVVSPAFASLLQTQYPPQIQLDALCSISLSMCFISEIIPTLNSNPMTGINIQGADQFNKFSSFFSKGAVVSGSGVLNSPTMATNLTALKTNTNRHQSSSSNVNIPWFKAGDTAASYVFTSVLVYDKARLLAAKRNTSPQTVTNVTTGSRGIMIRNNETQTTDGFGTTLFYYRGATAGNYDSVAEVPINNAYYIYDKGTSVNGYAINSRAVADIDTFTYVQSFKILDNNNVEFEATTPPVIGSFVSGDVCRNTNRAAGQVMFWVYNGSTWSASPVYA